MFTETRRRNKPWTKRLLGFLPELRPISAFRSHPSVREWKQCIARDAIKKLIEPIQVKRSGTFLWCGGKRVLLYPRVPFFICDEKELPLFTGLKGNGSYRPCNQCLIHFKKSSIHDIGEEQSLEEMERVSSNNYSILL